MNEYMIPANSNRGKLIFSIFRPIDLGILLFGASLTLILFFALSKGGILLTLASLLPIATALFLIMPVPNYHNVLVFLQEVYLFYISQRKFSWKGWCVRSGFTDEGR